MMRAFCERPSCYAVVIERVFVAQVFEMAILKKAAHGDSVGLSNKTAPRRYGEAKTTKREVLRGRRKAKRGWR